MLNLSVNIQFLSRVRIFVRAADSSLFRPNAADVNNTSLSCPLLLLNPCLIEAACL